LQTLIPLLLHVMAVKQPLICHHPTYGRTRLNVVRTAEPIGSPNILVIEKH
jgi:hypothetical protein